MYEVSTDRIQGEESGCDKMRRCYRVINEVLEMLVEIWGRGLGAWRKGEEGEGTRGPQGDRMRVI